MDRLVDKVYDAKQLNNLSYLINNSTTSEYFRLEYDQNSNYRMNTVKLDIVNKQAFSRNDLELANKWIQEKLSNKQMLKHLGPMPKGCKNYIITVLDLLGFIVNNFSTIQNRVLYYNHYRCVNDIDFYLLEIIKPYIKMSECTTIGKIINDLLILENNYKFAIDAYYDYSSASADNLAIKPRSIANVYYMRGKSVIIDKMEILKVGRWRSKVRSLSTSKQKHNFDVANRSIYVNESEFYTYLEKIANIKVANISYLENKISSIKNHNDTIVKFCAANGVNIKV